MLCLRHHIQDDGRIVAQTVIPLAPPIVLQISLLPCPWVAALECLGLLTSAACWDGRATPPWTVMESGTLSGKFLALVYGRTLLPGWANTLRCVHKQQGLALPLLHCRA
jgi:hypothetical protein